MDDPLPLPSFLRSRPAEPRRRDAPRTHVEWFDLDRQAVPGLPAFTGVHVYRDLLDADEADRLLRQIEKEAFVPAQSGKLKQHYGAKVNFNKRKINPSGFRGLPGYVHWIDSRLRQRVEQDVRRDASDLELLREALEAFEPTDAFVLRYHQHDASNLDFHRDDDFAYGEVILDLSLETDSVLSFLRAPEHPGVPERSQPNAPPICVRVPLPARSLAVLHGPARFEWEHAVLAFDIAGRRTSVTLRTLGATLRDTAAGQQILEVARSGRD